MGKHYLIFWRVLIIVSLALGGGCLFLAAKYEYQEYVLDIESKSMTILGSEITNNYFIFTSDSQNCRFRFDLNKFKTAEINELNKISIPTKANVTSLKGKCDNFIEVVAIETNTQKWGSLSNFNKRSHNMSNLYIFYFFLCLTMSLLSFFMLKISAWLLKKYASINSVS